MPCFRILVVIALVLAARATARADGFSDHLERAAAHQAHDELVQALAETEAAYALRQQPKLLLEMARLHRRLGHVNESVELYLRWLATGEGDAAARAEAEEASRRLLHLPVSLPAAPGDAGLFVQKVRYELQPRRGVMAGGAVLFTLSYAAAAFSGIAFSVMGESCGPSGSGVPCSSGSRRLAGGLLLIPVVGPIASGIAFREVYWAAPWALLDGVAQIAGLALMIGGRLHKHRVALVEDVKVAPSVSLGGGGLVVSGRF